jgi:hypothetical protein
MKSIIKSIKQTEFSTIITTKSNVVKVYTFSTSEQNNEFYNSQMYNTELVYIPTFTIFESKLINK